MLCLQAIMPQKNFYDFTSALHQNVTVGPERCIISGVIMAEHVCSSFSIKNDHSSEVYSPVNSLRGISKYYSMLCLLYYLSICPE